MDAANVFKYFGQRNLKHGNFNFCTEDRIIVQLGALLRNKWSIIASHLPKKIDKNYRNTNIKNMLTRMGIDSTHKPKSNTFDAYGGNQSNCMAQWESTQFEVEVTEFMLQVGSSCFVSLIY